MKTITLRVPSPFNTGPQYDEGELISGSWPAGLPHEGIHGWRQLGVPSGGLSLCEFIAEDDWPISSIPGGWRATGGHVWNLRDQSYTDENDVFHYGFTTEVPTNESDYLGHIPDATTYHRIHKYQGWPDIVD